MTKELELFKRWFGFEPEPMEDLINIEIDFYEPKIHLIFKNNVEPLYDCGRLVPGFYISPELGECFDKIKDGYLFEGKFSDQTNAIFPIPPQYHAEWEQYVKDKE